MTEMATTYHLELDESREKLVSSPQTSTGQQTLITEQQVLFSTAAAVALPRTKTRGWSDAIVSLVAGVGSWLASAAQPRRCAGLSRRGSALRTRQRRCLAVSHVFGWAPR